MAKLSAFTKNTSGLNSGAEVMAQKISLDKINVHTTFQTLLPINDRELANIVKDMEDNGFDKSKPVCIWREEDVLIDGYTRFTAAKEAGLTEIYKYEMSFETEQQALEYAMKQQLNRRNLSDAGKLLLIEKLDSLYQSGRPSDDETEERPKGKSAAALAEALGISTRSVERGRSVLKNADAETLDKIKSDKLSINKAAKEIAKKKKEEKSVPDEVEEQPTSWSATDSMNIDFDDSFDSFDDSDEDNEESVSPPVDDTIPLKFQPTLYDHIMEFDLHHLAVYLASVQMEESLTVAQWEDKLKSRSAE